MAADEPARILIVDDDARVRQYLRELIAEAGYRVDEVADGSAALARVERERPDLVLLDVVMPGMDGLEVLRFLKAPGEERFLPVILLTGDTDDETRLRGLRLGADDYLTKPANGREVLARIEALLRIKRLQDRLTASRQQLEDASLVEPVTGLYNARCLELRLGDEFKRAERYNEPLSCILLEIEALATLRAELGGRIDEQLFGPLAAVVRSGVREFDVVARSSAARFAVLLPRTHFSGAMAVAGRLWRAVREQRPHWPGAARTLQLVVGAAFFPDRDVDSGPALLAKAERALALARQQGPDRVCLLQRTAYFFQPDQEA